MKKTLLTLLLCIIVLPGICQTINGEKIEDIKSKYLLIMGTQRTLQPEIVIDVDFGQYGAAKIIKKKDIMNILDENGDFVKFNSMIDALNFFVQYGYKFVNAYAVSVNDTTKVYHWLLEKVE